MATHAERICCLDEYEIYESYFKGIILLFLKYFYPVIYLGGSKKLDCAGFFVYFE